MKNKVAERGDVYWINASNPAGHEIRGTHRYVVITTKLINQHGIAMTVPVARGGNFARIHGLTVPITGYDTVGVAVCNQIYSFDLNEHVKIGTAKFVETLDPEIVDAIIDRVVSILDPEELR